MPLVRENISIIVRRLLKGNSPCRVVNSSSACLLSISELTLFFCTDLDKPNFYNCNKCDVKSFFQIAV